MNERDLSTLRRRLYELGSLSRPSVLTDVSQCCIDQAVILRVPKPKSPVWYDVSGERESLAFGVSHAQCPILRSLVEILSDKKAPTERKESC
jgi:hypothetical protein